MVLHAVGISEMAVSDNPEDILATYSLGSCVGLALYDPGVRLGGLIHCMLPLSRIDPNKAAKLPAMFVDTGVPRLIQAMLNRGARKARLIAKAAGAAHLFDDDNLFNIGARNYTMLRKILWKNDILIVDEDVAGTNWRTLYLHIDTGRTMVRSNEIERELSDHGWKV